MKIRISSQYSIGETTFELIKITNSAILIVKTVHFKQYPNLITLPSYTVVLIDDQASTDIWAPKVTDVLNCTATYPWTRLEQRLIKRYQNLLTKRINMLFYLANRERRRRLCNG